MKILIISASPRKNSHSRVLADAAFNYLEKKEGKFEVSMIDLYETKVDVFRGFGEEYNEETNKVIEMLKDHDVFIISTPVYNASFSSVLKNIFEHSNYKALKGKTAGFIMNAGGPVSFVNVNSDLNSLMNYFGMFSNPTSANVLPKDFDKEMKLEGEVVKERIKDLVDSTIDIGKKLES